MRILVTGGGGFLGSTIVFKALARGYVVKVLGRSEYPSLTERGIECVKGDVADPEAVRRAVAGCEAIIHTASIPGMSGPYSRYHAVNLLGTENVIAAARAAGIARLVYTSTPSVVYGDKDIDGGDESLPYPKRYLTSYAATKAEAEQKVLRANDAALATLAIRPHLIFGPGDTQLIPKVLQRLRAGALRRIGAGRNLISVSYVENVADAHLLALEQMRPGCRQAGQAYFVNEPEPVNCWDFINLIAAGVGLPPIRKSVPFFAAYALGWLMEVGHALRGGEDDPPLTRFIVKQLATSHWFRTDKAQREFGWRPDVAFDEGVRRMIESLKEQADKV